jgi:hypothetical protein
LRSLRGTQKVVLAISDGNPNTKCHHKCTTKFHGCDCKPEVAIRPLLCNQPVEDHNRAREIRELLTENLFTKVPDRTTHPNDSLVNRPTLIPDSRGETPSVNTDTPPVIPGTAATQITWGKVATLIKQQEQLLEEQVEYDTSEETTNDSFSPWLSEPSAGAEANVDPLSLITYQRDDELVSRTKALCHLYKNIFSATLSKEPANAPPFDVTVDTMFLLCRMTAPAPYVDLTKDHFNNRLRLQIVSS